MIYHIKCAGVIRTQPRDPGIFECQGDGSTWTEKPDVWQDCARHEDVPNDVKVSPHPADVKALLPVRDPLLPRKGVVEEKEPPAIEAQK